MGTMRAMVLREWGGGLEMEERPIPDPGPGEVLLRVGACGVGYTLSNIRAGRMAASPNASLPRVLGNEISGEVARLGSGVTGTGVGDRAMVHFYLACGRCRECLRDAHEPLCERLQGFIGVATDGGFAEYVVVPASNLVALPDNVSHLEGCVTADAVATPWHALKRVAPVKPGDTLAVVGGGGGVGIQAVTIGKLMGAHVVAVDITDEKLAFAREHGADEVVDGRSDDVAHAVRDAAWGRGPDVVLDYVASEKTIQDALEYIALRGRIVIQGVNPPGAQLRIEPRWFVAHEVAVTGARHASRTEYAEAAELVSRGVLHPVVTETVPLERVEELFGLLDRRELLGRGAVVFDD